MSNASDKLSKSELINIIEHDYHQIAFNKEGFLAKILNNQERALLWEDSKKKIQIEKDRVIALNIKLLQLNKMYLEVMDLSKND